MKILFQIFVLSILTCSILFPKGKHSYENPYPKFVPYTIEQDTTKYNIANIDIKSLGKEQPARWLSVDPLADKYPGWSPYNYCVNNPLVYFDPNGEDWFYYQAQKEKEATWHYQEGHEATYTDVDGNEQKTNTGYEYLVKYEYNINEDGEAIGTTTLYKQDEVVVQSYGVFSGGGGHPSIEEGNYYMNMGIRDSHGPNLINTPKGPNTIPFSGIQKIPVGGTTTLDGNLMWNGTVRDAYGGGRIRLNYSGNNNYYLHGKDDLRINYTHGCVCDRSEKIFNYFWNSKFRGIVPFNAKSF